MSIAVPPSGRGAHLVAVLAGAVLAANVVACGDTGKAVTASSSHTVPVISHSSQPPQDDDHISIYGHEAVGAERVAILRLVRRYYAAAAAGDGVVACSLIYSRVARSVVEDYGRNPATKGRTCAAVMKKVFRKQVDQTPAVIAHTQVTGVRVRGASGFAQLRSRAMRTGEIALEREGATWKVSVLIGRACQDCYPVSP